MWTTVSERLESRGGPALVEAEVKDVGDQNRRAFSETHLRVLDDIVAGQASCIFQPKVVRQQCQSTAWLQRLIAA
jgi:hypothetical protein